MKVTTRGNADLDGLVADAAQLGAEWNGGWVEIRATFATPEQREAAARALANVADAETTTTTASYERDDTEDTAPQAGDSKPSARWRTRARAQLVAAYRPRRRDPLSAPLIAVPLSIAILAGWIIAFALFRDIGPHDDLPGVALGSKLLLDVIRATVVVALIGAGMALIVRSALAISPQRFPRKALSGRRWRSRNVRRARNS